jgi:hypothetical protein
MGKFRLRAAVATVGIAIGVLGIAVVPGADAKSNVPAGTITFINKNVTRCLGIADGNAGIYNCTYVRDQAWNVIGTLTENHITWAQLQNSKGQCLGVAGGRVHEGTRIVGEACNSANQSQYWNNTRLNAVCGSGFTPVINYASGYVMGVRANETGNGSPVVIWPYQGHCNNQFWVAKVDLT